MNSSPGSEGSAKPRSTAPQSGVTGPNATETAQVRTSPVREFTLRAVILGGIITLIFTAANVYLGLRVGLTFATSIPAAVISMAILRNFKNHTIQENNIVQTIASAAGTLSAIIFVLPGLIMVGWWQGFPYWTTAAVCAIGGILGVMFSIPLRRALVTGSDLPFPEGVAAAEVLKVGDTHPDLSTGSTTGTSDLSDSDATPASTSSDPAVGATPSATDANEENKQGLRMIIAGAFASAGMAILGAMKLAATELSTFFRVGSGGTMVGGSLSLALIGVGHLVGLSVGISMIIGLIISRGVLLPMHTSGLLPAEGDISDVVSSTFATDVRFIGAGAMAIAAVWALLKIIGPIIKGIKESLASSRARQAGETVALTEKDIPFPVVAGVTLGSMIPVGILLWLFVKDSAITHHMSGLIILSIVYTLLVGLIVASICGYMAGLIGASNSPISGVGIIVVLSAALLIKVVVGGDADADTLVAYTLFTAAVVFGIATISNDNLQDLKTGQLVRATPWKQQLALVFGVIFGSIVIPPILELMLKGFGFAGAPGAGADALPAPQAALLSSVAKGIFGNSLDWGLIGLGAAIGAVVIVINEILSKTGKFSLPPLAVGMGMYLPASLALVIPIGALLGFLFNKWADKQANAERTKRMGVLMATGLIVGESLFGVINAGIIAATSNGDALAVVGEEFEKTAQWIGLALFILLTALVYNYVKKSQAQKNQVTEAA
ncbi:putative membrane protein [Corynebacterium resistens DSM 45100]|uniref:Membrane protein n=1 Tax=Corynebacterium resistens (strain DSM 45100 / JCM 12819 / GTC 2026 / SICGH 158) TaxID=662755 RepID=F8DYL6_CORRG|nr:oligopeptide transporter, OPT family [Corynebacterium resistens]AEI09681.1 putative membrane protein [Corynebacterium resistens DSM 45100]